MSSSDYFDKQCCWSVHYIVSLTLSVVSDDHDLTNHCHHNIGRLMIMDEDIDLSKVKFGYNLEEEEAPTIAEVIDERPDVIRQMEVFASNKKWKKMIAGE